MTPKEALTDPQCPAAVLLAIAMKKYGNEVLEFDPVILRHDLETDFKIELTDVQADKLQAALTVINSDNFEQNLEVFELACHLFCNNNNDFEDWEPLEVEEVICGTCEATLIRHEKLDYSDDVRAYVGQVFFEGGFLKPPELFPSAILPVTLPAEEIEQHMEQEKERNEAFLEMFNDRLGQIVNYMNSVDMESLS